MHDARRDWRTDVVVREPAMHAAQLSTDTDALLHASLHMFNRHMLSNVYLHRHMNKRTAFGQQKGRFECIKRRSEK